MSQVITGMLNTQIAGGRSPASRVRRSTWASAARALASGKDGTAAPHKAKAAEGGRRLSAAATGGRGCTAATYGPRWEDQSWRGLLTMRPDSCRAGVPAGVLLGAGGVWGTANG
jgi:hypothetical protein